LQELATQLLEAFSEDLLVPHVDAKILSTVILSVGEVGESIDVLVLDVLPDCTRGAKRRALDWVGAGMFASTGNEPNIVVERRMLPLELVLYRYR